MDSGGGDDDALEYFESSIESLFGQHQCATGEPGQLCELKLSDDGGATDATVVRYRIPASATNRLFAHYQWDAGMLLARLIHRTVSQKRIGSGMFKSDVSAFRQEADVRELSVLELGAGTGLPGLISAKNGASTVLLTDYPDEGILSAMEENIRLFNVQHVVRSRGLDWSDDETVASIRHAYPDGFERILCADLLWLSSSHMSLLRTIKALLAPTSTARCIIVSGFHTGRRAVSHFFRLACSDGREAELRPSVDVDGSQVALEYNIVEGRTRPWSGATPFPSGQSADDAEQVDTADNMDDFTERTKWLSYVSLQWSDMD